MFFCVFPLRHGWALFGVFCPASCPPERKFDNVAGTPACGRGFRARDTFSEACREGLSAPRAAQGCMYTRRGAARRGAARRGTSERRCTFAVFKPCRAPKEHRNWAQQRQHICVCALCFFFILGSLRKPRWCHGSPVAGTPKHGLHPVPRHRNPKTRTAPRVTETHIDTQIHTSPQRHIARSSHNTRAAGHTTTTKTLCVCCVFFSSSVPSAIQVVPRTDCAPCHGRPVTGPEPQNTDCAPRTAPHAMEAPFLEPQNTDCAPSHDANVIYTI